MRFLRKNTAVIVTVGPFYDKTDGVTIETALTITNERITLTADTDDNSAPTNILDNVTGATSATSNDLNYITGNDAGMMQLELSASNTNRLGRMLLSITDAANHVPVFHEFMVVNEALYDAFFGSSGGAIPNVAAAAVGGLVTAPTTANTALADATRLLGTAIATPATAGLLDVNVKQISTDATAADNAEAFFDGTGYAGTGNVIPTVTAVTGLTASNLDTTVSSRLAPTTAGRTLDVTATGAAGIDWGNLENPTTAVNLSATNIDVDQVVASVSGAVGSVGAGGIAGSSFAAGAISSTVIADSAITAMRSIISGTADSGTTTTLTDAALAQGNDNWNGCLLLITTGGLSGQCRLITDFDSATDTLTVTPAFTSAIGTQDYEILAWGRTDLGTPSEIANAVWNEDATGHQTTGTFGQAIGDPVADTNSIYKAVVTDATGATVGVDVVAVKAETAAILTDTAEIGTAGDGLTNINLPNQIMDITGNITGNLSGSVGSVTGAVGSVASGGITTASFASGAIDAAAVASNVTTELRALASGTADSGTTTTMVDAVRTEADTDYWYGNVILFTSGNIAGQARLITGFNASTDTITFTPATTQAVSTQTYEILPWSMVNVALWRSATPNGLTSGRIDTTVGAMQNDVVTAAAIATDAITSVELNTSAIDEIVDAVWDEATSGHNTNGTFGQRNQIVRANTAQAGASTTITLDASASAVDDFYNNDLIFITAGTGVGQSRFISDYVGSTKVATVSAWVTNPSTDSVFVIFPFGSIPGATAPTAAEVADAVWDEAQADHKAVGSFGQGQQSIRTGTAQAAASSSITLDTGASSVDGYYAGTIVLVTGGSAGTYQARLISGYTGSTRVAAITPAWTTTPTGTIEFVILPFGRVDVAQWLGSFVNALTSGAVPANVASVTNGAIVAADFASDYFTAINAEALDVVNTDTISQLTQGIPPSAPTMRQAIMYLYQWFRNKLTQTATETAMWDDAGTTKIAKATITNDGTTTTKDEFVSGA